MHTLILHLINNISLKFFPKSDRKFLRIVILKFSIFKAPDGKIKKGKIIGGERAKFKLYPLYQVSLMMEHKSICGGSIIDMTHVITAAHCFVNETGFVFNQSVKILAGVNDLRNPLPIRIVVDVEKFSIPLDYFKYNKDRHPEGDIAVLKVTF